MCEDVRSCNDLLSTAPLDDEGFTLTDRWFCEVMQTFYPVGTTVREILRDMEDVDAHQIV